MNNQVLMLLGAVALAIVVGAAVWVYASTRLPQEKWVQLVILKEEIERRFSEAIGPAELDEIALTIYKMMHLDQGSTYTLEEFTDLLRRLLPVKQNDARSIGNFVRMEPDDERWRQEVSVYLDSVRATVDAWNAYATVQPSSPATD